MREFRASWRRLAGVGAIAATAAALVATTASPASAAPKIVDAGGPNAIADSYIITFKNNLVGVQAVSTLSDTLAAKVGATVKFKYEAALRGFAGSMSESAAKTLATDPNVASVSQDHKIKVNTDQLNPPSWGLDRVDQRDRPLNQKYSHESAANVNAYIIDTGIRTTHTTFGGRATFDFNSADSSNTDCHGHGTHVAGTVGGGEFGMAKDVKLHAVKVLDCTGFGTTAGVIAGIDWVTSHAIKPAVANMSLGGDAEEVLDVATRNSIASGITYAVASGNDNTDACVQSPARVAEAITVNATDINDRRAWFSNYGTCTDLFAPGLDITSAWNNSDTGTRVISGTSMAAPHVAGAAALYLAANPTATPQQVRDEIVIARATLNRVLDPEVGSANYLLYTGAATNVLRRGESLEVNQVKKSPSGGYSLKLQDDGNLVLYNAANVALWHTGTWGNTGKALKLQDDGNLVLYNAANVALWHTSTWNTAANLLTVQDDGNVVLYGPRGQVFWHRFQ